MAGLIVFGFADSGGMILQLGGQHVPAFIWLLSFAFSKVSGL
jgi:hypothetical protein